MATIVEQLSQAQETIKTFEAEKKALNDKVSAAEAVTKSANEAKSKAEADLKSAQDAHAGDVAEKEKALKAEQSAHEATRVELAKAKQALANPAFADAAIVGSKKPAPEGGIASDTPPMTPDEAAAKYKAISDPKARAAFRKENWKILGIAEEK